MLFDLVHWTNLMINDRRQFKKFKTLLIVDIRSHSEPSSFFFGITKNISFEGFVFESQNFNLKPGDILEFKLKHPKKDLSLTVVGEVIWREKTQYEYLAGVNFRRMNEEIMGKILKLVSTDQDIVTERDINKEDPEIIVAETIDNSVLTEQPDAQDQSLISEAISRSLSDSKSDKSRSISSSSLKESTDTSKSPSIKKDETARTESLISFWDLDIKIPKQNRKSSVHKTAVLIAAITVVASLSFVFWKSRVPVDTSALNASNDTAIEDIEYDPEINMQALQDASDSGLPVIFQESSSLSEPEDIAETELPPVKQEPSVNVKNKLIALNKDSMVKSLTTNISSENNKQESKYRGTSIATITEDDNKLIPVPLQPLKEVDKEQIAKAESIISEPEDPKSVELTESPQLSESKRATDIVPKKNEAELSKKFNNVMVSDQKDNTVHSEAATDNIPIYPKNAQAALKPENLNEMTVKINQQPKEIYQGDYSERTRIIKYSVKPKKYYLQVGVWKNSDDAKKVLSQLKRNYAKAYSFSKDNFQIIIIPDILTKSQGAAMSKEIENKFDIKLLMVEMDEKPEISSKAAMAEIYKMDIVDKDLTSTDSIINAKEPYAGIVDEPLIKAKLENTNEMKIILKIKKSDAVANMTPSSNKSKIALVIKKSTDPSSLIIE